MSSLHILFRINIAIFLFIPLNKYILFLLNKPQFYKRFKIN